MNIAQKIAKESTITFTGMLYGNINRYLYIALMARWMGIEYVGIYSIANAIMLLGEVISKMGLETGIMRFVSRLDIQKEKNMIKSIIESSLKMVIIFSIVITFLIIFFSSTLTNIYNGTPLLKLAIILFALSIPFNSITVVSAFASQGFKLLKYKVFTTQFLNPSILLVSMIFCYLFISKVSAIILPIVVSSIIGSIAMLILLRKISNISIKNIIYSKFNKKLFVYSTPLMFVAVFQTLMHWMDILMLGFYLDTKIVGLYHPAARTAGLLQALLLSFISIYAPMVSELHKQNNISEISKIYKLVTRWLFSISIPIALVFILYPKKVMLLFGPEYIAGYKILIVLTIATFIQTVLGCAGPILSMTGHTKLVFKNSCCAFILNLWLNILLIPRFGVLGAAYATLFSIIVIGLLRVIEVQYLFKLSFFSFSTIKPIFAGLITGIIIIYLKSYFMQFHTLVTLVCISILSITIFGIILWLLKIESEDIDFLLGLKILRNIKK